MNSCNDVQSSVFTINQLMNYECPALLMLIRERDHHSGDYVSCCVRTVCGLFDDLPNFSMNKIGRGCTFYRPYAKRLQSLTVYGCHYKDSALSSVHLRPWLLVRPRVERAASLLVDRRLSNS